MGINNRPGAAGKPGSRMSQLRRGRRGAGAAAENGFESGFAATEQSQTAQGNYPPSRGGILTEENNNSLGGAGFGGAGGGGGREYIPISRGSSKYN